jgi:hypothetical protein
MEKFTLVADGLALAAVVMAVFYVKPRRQRQTKH